MRWIGCLYRSIALKSNRSQDPVVVTNIRLSKCQELDEVFSIIKSTSTQRTNHYFALRAIARLIQTNRKNMNSLQSDTYNKLIEDVNSSISDMKSLELSDFMFFIKMTQEYGFKNLLGDWQIFENKIDEIFKSGSITIRNISNLLHYGQLSGFLCEDMFTHIYSSLLDLENDYLTLMEMKIFSRSLKIQRVCNNEKYTMDYMNKIDQLSEKSKFEVNSLLYILKNLAVIGKMSHKRLPLDNYFDTCIKQIDFFSENDYNLILKIQRDTPGLIDPQVTRTLLDRIQKSIEKNSTRLSTNFLIDCIPMIINDPANNKLINKIVDFSIQKLQNRDIRLIVFSKLCMNLIKSPREQINCVFNQALMNAMAGGNFLDFLLFRSRYDSKSVLKEYNINDEKINEYLMTRNFKTLIFHYLNFKDFENCDIQLINDKIKLKIKNFIDFSTLNARSLFGVIRDMDLSNEAEPGSLNEFNTWIQNKLITEFNHSNLVYLMFIKENEKITFEYIKTHKDLINLDVLALAVIENCFFITDTKLKFLLDVFPYSCSLRLAYVIQSLRKDPSNKSALQMLTMFNSEKMLACEVYKFYSEEVDQILRLL